MADAEALKVGSIIEGKQQRDAIHIAIAPIVASQDMRPGERVVIDRYGRTHRGLGAPYVGIVDPYLSGPVKRGQTFWLFLKPGSITSLRHDWTHPKLDEKTEARQRFEEFAKQLEMPYDDLVTASCQYLRSGENCYLGFDTPELDMKEFWEAFHDATGIVVPDEEKESHFFSCSC